jgi:ABC-type transport system substrate-binding protein
VWVSVRPRRRADEGGGGTVRVETHEVVDFLDPALAYVAQVGWQIQYATCAKLVNYPDEPGAAGAVLSPELSETLPRPTGGGRTYTFRIRRGFRFSPPSGEPVTARTLKESIERSMHPRMQSPAAGFMSDLAGASAYAAGSARHVSGITAAGDTLTVRLTRPSSSFLYRLSLPFFCAVPIGTPIDPEGLRKVPSAGPYYVASHAPGEEVVLRRNPNYRGSRPQRPDRVRIILGAGQAGTIARVAKGEVDYLPSVNDLRSARRLEARYGPERAAAKAGGQRYFAHPLLQLNYLAFNTSRGPFASARLRRAVNYAIDRRALSREGLFYGLPATPTDQYLPPAMPGYRDARIYPLTPDLRKARQLSGTTRRSIVLYALSEPAHLRVAEIVKANLRSIGMDVQIRAFGESFFARLQRRGEPFDIALVGWQSDYPNPVDVLHQLDGRTIGPDGNVNYSYYDDPRYNRRLDAAAALASPARELALGRLDVEVARSAAPWAAIGNERTHSFFSARMGCQLHNPIFGIDLAALCIRGRSR